MTKITIFVANFIPLLTTQVTMIGNTIFVKKFSYATRVDPEDKTHRLK